MASETRFRVGQHVKSLVDSQDLVKGKVYVVKDIFTQDLGIFGVFVTYLLEDEDNDLVEVSNGHLILTESEGVK